MEGGVREVSFSKGKRGAEKCLLKGVGLENLIRDQAKAAAT